MRILVALLSPLLVACAATAKPTRPPADDVVQRIHRVEHGLLPAIQGRT